MVSFPQATWSQFLLLLFSTTGDAVGPVACVGFLMAGTGAWFLVGGAEFFPSDEQGHVGWYVLGCL